MAARAKPLYPLVDSREDAVYARQSIDKKDSISIETQILHAEKEAGEGARLRAPYVDKGFSGKDTNRPGFQRLMKDVEQGLIRRVIVYRLDRFSRSLLDFSSMMQRFEEHGVAFVSTKEKFDTSTAIGKAMLSIVMVFAQLERETLQERITDNFHARVEQGWGMGGLAPYGLCREPVIYRGIHTKIYAGQEPALSILKELFRRYASTPASLGALTKELNGRGVPSPGGSYWDSAKISRLLRNPVYVRADAQVFRYYADKGANIVNGIREFDGLHSCYLYGNWDRSRRKGADYGGLNLSLTLSEGHVDSDTFLRVQAKLDANRQLRRNGQSRHSWLSGLTKCGKCGYTMTVAASQKDRAPRKVFYCRGRSQYHVCEGHSRAFHVAEAEAVVEDRLLAHLGEKAGLRLTPRAVAGEKEGQYRQELGILEEQIQNLLQAVAEGDPLAAKYIQPRLAELDSRKAALESEYRAYQYREAAPLPQYPLSDIRSHWPSLSLDQKKSVAALFIQKILFFDDGLEIVWKHRFD